MIKKILYAVSLFPFHLLAQQESHAAGSGNLVPNPGFESYKQAPCSWMGAEITEYIHDWSSFGGTADIIYAPPVTRKECYACTESTNNDRYGNETPHGGNGMGMLMTYGHEGSYREYFKVKLSRPLQKGKKYYVEFYASFGDRCTVATNNLGIAFCSDFSKLNGDGITTGIHPAINETKIIEQKDGWQKISGTFVADNDYTYLLIGNFLTDQNTLKKQIPQPKPNSSTDGIAAYYIDDVCVREDVHVHRAFKPLKELNDRAVKSKRTIDIDEEEVSVYVYDKGQIDRDSISIYVGDSCIVQGIVLGKRKTKVCTLKVEKGQPCQVIFYALNLGEIPPNTATVLLVSGKNNYTCVLSSDLENCDSMILRRKKDD